MEKELLNPDTVKYKSNDHGLLIRIQNKLQAGEDGLTTLSEAFQKKLNRKDCPYLHDCGIYITGDFFRRICNSPSYLNCHHFAKRVGELRPPMAWLQKLAVDQAKMMEQQIEAEA